MGHALSNEHPFFNRDFIKSAKILEIRGQYTFKKQGDIMRQTDYVYIYSFDIQGRLVREYETAKGTLANDTVVKFYTYDNINRLRSMRVNAKSGFVTTYYTYDDLGRVIKEEVWRDIDTLNGKKLQPNVERSIHWNTETMAYDDKPMQRTKSVFNNVGKQYLECISTFDSLGYLTRVRDIFSITRDQVNTLYTYTNKGYVEAIRKYKNAEKTPYEEIVFTYDKYGNVSSKKLYTNGVFKTEYQVIYSDKTGLLSSMLIREVSTNFISIIRFSEPTFWE